MGNWGVPEGELVGEGVWMEETEAERQALGDPELEEDRAAEKLWEGVGEEEGLGLPPVGVGYCALPVDEVEREGDGESEGVPLSVKLEDREGFSGVAVVVCM